MLLKFCVGILKKIKKATVLRAKDSFVFPASFMLIAVMGPCPYENLECMKKRMCLQFLSSKLSRIEF